MTLFVVWAFAATAYFITRAIEWQLHKRNYFWLANQAEVEEWGSGWMRFYYGLQTSWVLSAPLEFVVSDGSLTRPQPVGQTALFLAALFLAGTLRFWSIVSLGPYWCQRLVVTALSYRVKIGPYRWLKNPEYLARIAEGVALAGLLQAQTTTLVFLAISISVTIYLMYLENCQRAEINFLKYGLEPGSHHPETP